jgi:hypothetical protein
MTELKNKFKIGDKIKCFNRTGIIVDLLDQIENIWVKILYDETDHIYKYLDIEKAISIELITEPKIITITI